ncbi:MAG: recombinase family protein, partial [Clostridia bacterium]|nr:recombinase family protein [Clostridia bacterium]
MLAYGYCRYSSDLQNETSIEQQKGELEEYARKNGIVITKYYIDEAKSGTKNNRESFQDMISDACKFKKVEAILVWKTDRFARNAMDSLMYRNQLAKHGIKLVSITQPIDDSTPEGKLMTTFLAGMDEYYSENLASNIKRALKSNAKESLFNGGIPPLGYNIKDKKYVINEKEANIVRTIFKMYLDGYSLIDIAIKLNSKGYKTKKGTEFKKYSVQSILGNEKYIGNYVFNKGYKDNNKIERTDIIRNEGALPSIISKEMFDMVKLKRQNNKKNSGSFKARTVYLLSGLVKCSDCGGNYVGITTKKIKNGKEYKSSYYQCSNRNKLSNCTSVRLKKEPLEKYIVDLIYKKLLDTEEVNTLLKEINKAYKQIYDEASENLDDLKERIAQKQLEIDNISQAIATGVHSPTLLANLEKAEDIKQMLEKELSLKSNVSKHKTISMDVIKFVLQKDIDLIDSKQSLKNVIQKWIKKIEVQSDSLLIYFNFDNKPLRSYLRMVAMVGLEPT